MIFKYKFLCLVTFLLISQLSFAEIITYKAPKCDLVSTAYSLKIREHNNSWLPLDVYQARVTNVIKTKTIREQTSFAYFDCDGIVEVELTIPAGGIKDIKIRPLAYGIAPIIKGKKVTFSINVNQYVSIEINGDIFHNLQLFANEIERSKPTIKDTNILFYGPGIHRIGKVNLPSNKTVYIAGGAIVVGSFLMDHAKNVNITGHGILTQTEPDLNATKPFATDASKVKQGRGDLLTINYSENVNIEGLIVLPYHYSIMIGQSSDVKVKHFKSFSSEGNADGIDIFCSSDVILDHIFMRNSDDCIAIYGHRWNYFGNTRNITVKDAILWADVAHPILIGTHGDSQNPDTLENITFNNIQILDQHENQIDYQGCMALNSGDSNLIRNVTFQDVTIENIRKGQLVNLRVMYNAKYNTSPGAGIENVLFKNIFYKGENATLSIITGYDDKRKIKHVVFDNLNINGKCITDNMAEKPGFYKTGDMANFFIGEHTEDVKFINSHSDHN